MLIYTFVFQIITSQILSDSKLCMVGKVSLWSLAKNLRVRTHQKFNGGNVRKFCKRTVGLRRKNREFDDF